MGVIDGTIDNTREMVVGTGIGLKDMFNLKITIEAIGHITIKKNYQSCHETYHLWQNLSELTPSHSLPGTGPFRRLDEVFN